MSREFLIRIKSPSEYSGMFVGPQIGGVDSPTEYLEARRKESPEGNLAPAAVVPMPNNSVFELRKTSRGACAFPGANLEQFDIGSLLEGEAPCVVDPAVVGFPLAVQEQLRAVGVETELIPLESPFTHEGKALLDFIFSGSYRDSLDGKPLSSNAGLLFQCIDNAYRTLSGRSLEKELLETLVTFCYEPLTNVNEHRDSLEKILSRLEERLYGR